MAWRLVEEHGGLSRLREALAARGPRRQLDARLPQGLRRDGRASWPPGSIRTVGAEPIGTAVQPRRPHLPPRPGGS